MRRTIFAVAVLGSLTPAAAEERDPSTYPTTRGPHSCGNAELHASEGHVELPPPGGIPRRAGEQRVIYLNKNGGTYTFVQGNSDSSTNMAFRGAASGKTTATVPKMSQSFQWATVRDCVKDHFAPFNARIVETEPTTGEWTEAVVGGDGSELGHSPQRGILGIAAVQSVCALAPRGISFSFSENHIGIPQRALELCATIAHEIGHTIALEHASLADEIMSYVPVNQAPNKAFLTQASPCGTQPGESFPCTCGGSSQNSAQKLDTTLGAKPTDSTKPSLTVDFPKEGDRVSPAFEVVASASDASGMGDVRVIINNEEVGNAQAQSDGKWRVRGTALIGAQPMTIIARDTSGNETMQVVNVTVALAETGASCVANNACEGGLCANAETDGYCTETCTASDTCPDGFSCASAGTQMVCIPDEGGGCCQTSDDLPVGGALLAVGAGLVLVRRRRSA